MTRKQLPQGLHHVAFATRDKKATYEFYANRLGMPLVHTENHLTGDGWFQHFFFDMGNGACLAFFAFENVGEKQAYRTDISTGAGMPVWVNHVAFNLPDIDALAAKKAEIENAGVEIFMETDHGWCQSIYMIDPNGIMVEFTTTTDTAAFGQTAEDALELLLQEPSGFGEKSRKDTTTVVHVNREVAKKIRIADPAR